MRPRLTSTHTCLLYDIQARPGISVFQQFSTVSALRPDFQFYLLNQEAGKFHLSLHSAVVFNYVTNLPFPASAAPGGEKSNKITVHFKTAHQLISAMNDAHIKQRIEAYADVLNTEKA